MQSLHGIAAHVGAFWNAPLSFQKAALISAIVLIAFIIYVFFHVDWVAQGKAIPSRIATAWHIHRKSFAYGLAFVPAGIVLGWFVWIRQQHGNLGEIQTISGGVLASSLVLVGLGNLFMSVSSLLLSPFDTSQPNPGLDVVAKQKAYGDAQPAGATEVDHALRGGSGRIAREFED
jgi:hypothetical protein